MARKIKGYDKFTVIFHRDLFDFGGSSACPREIRFYPRRLSTDRFESN